MEQGRWKAWYGLGLAAVMALTPLDSAARGGAGPLPEGRDAATAHAQPAPAIRQQGAAIHAAAAYLRMQAGRARLLLLGEFHGTRETPDLVEALVTAYANEAPVLLGLEMPREEQASLNDYLRSDGSVPARTALRARPFWTRRDDQHDGRRSEDMLDLIEAVRRLRAQGRDVALLAYDIDPDAPRTDRDARDAAMAEHVRRAMNALPRGRLLVLTGNVHAMLQRPAHAPAQLPVPMGSHLLDLSPWSVRITARDGHFWACLGGGRCGPAPADGATARTGPAGGEYTHHLVLPRFTPAHLIGAPR